MANSQGEGVGLPCSEDVVVVSDSARKRTVRERMSVTGDSYSTAARTVDKSAEGRQGDATAIAETDPQPATGTSTTAAFMQRDWVFIADRGHLWKIVAVGSESAKVYTAGNPGQIDEVRAKLLRHHATMHTERALPDRQREALDNLRLLGAWPDNGWVVKDRSTTRATLRRLAQRELAIEDRRNPGRFLATPPQTDPPAFIGPLLKGLYPCRHSSTGGSEDGVHGECRLDAPGRGKAHTAGRTPMDESYKASICKLVGRTTRHDETDGLYLITVRTECVIPSCGCTSPPDQHPAERRLPGRPRPAAVVLEEYNKAREEARGRFKPDVPVVLRQFYTDVAYPPAEKLWRWRIQLSCGCITERLTRDATAPPVRHRQEDIYTGEKLLPGQVICSEHKAREPYRTVLEYISRKEHTFPARTGDDVPEVLRRDEPETKALWKVRLCCGHIRTQCTSLSWGPGDGFPPSANFATPAERAEAYGRIEEARGHISQQELDHWQRMIGLGWPEPNPEGRCYSCARAKTIIAYEPVGPLVRPPKRPRTAAPKTGPGKTALARRLREVEAEAARLRAQLDDLHQGDRSPRA